MWVVMSKEIVGCVIYEIWNELYCH